MNAAGYTRQWRYKRDRDFWRIEEAEERGLRWCIRCGRNLARDLRLNTLYCSPSCRERARQMRRARGVRRDAFLRHPVKVGEKLDWRELAELRARNFYLCHGRVISEARRICPKWRKGRFV